MECPLLYTLSQCVYLHVTPIYPCLFVLKSFLCIESTVYFKINSNSRNNKYKMLLKHP